MPKDDTSTNLQELKDMVIKFRDERGWIRHHSPKNLAISICLEAAELLEHFQWDDYSQQGKQEVADELADIMFNCFNFADIMDIDMSTAFRDKFKKIEKKYPVEIFHPDHDSREDYNRIKQAYRHKKDH
jgi:dCTP diphosphatase